MFKPWFLNLLLVVAVVVASSRLIDVVGQRAEDVPGTAAMPPPPKVRPLVRPHTVAAEFQDVVDKNLFDAERGKKATAVADVPPPAAPPPSQPPKASLFGIMIDPEGNKFAFLTDDGAGTGAKAKRYREGERLSGAKIKEIRPDRVIFTVGATDHVIALRAPKEGLAAFQPPAAEGARPAPAVQRRPVRRAPTPGQRAQSRRPAPVRRRTVPGADAGGYEGAWDGRQSPFEEDPFEENPFEENPLEESPFDETPFVDDPYEENPFGEGEEW